MSFNPTADLGLAVTLLAVILAGTFYAAKSMAAFLIERNKLDGLLNMSIVLFAGGVYFQLIGMLNLVSGARQFVMTKQDLADDLSFDILLMAMLERDVSYYAANELELTLFAISVPLFIVTSILTYRQRIAHGKRAMTSAQAVHDARR